MSFDEIFFLYSYCKTYTSLWRVLNMLLHEVASSFPEGGFCHARGEHIFINPAHMNEGFQHPTGRDIMLEHMLQEFSKARDHTPHKRYVVHISLRSASLRQVETYCTFIAHCCDAFRLAFPNNLDTCYLYHEPFAFATLYRLLSRLLDRETRRRLVLYSQMSMSDNQVQRTTQGVDGCTPGR